ncbi:hypothetical protein QYE76_015011 [Lolium multiflorum]|uniref:Leucine-rich repeat-containing N-terminal plant-type domain-containing protein n=1 Tax=Lolium multiflorum TaxID=4521 RepID=A0AAD8X9A4_LOLMU|nr:hypothetical protein QYE76_015011 [Lolium multiflorum]
MAAASFLFLLILATASSVDCTSQVSNGSCFSTERAALLSFKAGITGDPANRLVSWQQGDYDCCRWSGVTCSGRTGHVVKLDLRNSSPTEDEYEVIGFEDPQSHSLRGQVSSSLLGLRRSLRHLDLSMNTALGGAMAMPGFLGSLQRLTYLNLSRMGFHGIVPPQLGNLSKLVQLDIGRSGDDNLYSNDISWLPRLRSLEHLNMAFVDLTGVDDWVHKVNALPNLVVLILQRCRLTAPSALLRHNLTVLEELDLSDNSFNTLAVPNFVWDITSLKSLSLLDCGLSGPFPDELGNLTLLETFRIAYNNFKGMIPGTLHNMCNLRSLQLGYNNIGADISEVIERIPKCSWRNLQELSLAYANITGEALTFVSNLTSLRKFDVSDNQLSGSVPVEIGTLTNLTVLDLGNNNLSGVISEDHLAGLMNLKLIDLSYNYLEFTIGSRWVPQFNLVWASLSSCHLGPQFPNWFRRQQSINYLDISNTGLLGRIPDWFWTTFSHAGSLDISLNQLSGDLPLSLEFMSVVILSMQSNILTGLIPKLPRTIEVLDISRNSLSGFVPNFQALQLQVAVLFSNSITGTIRTLVCRSPELRVLDLSNNFLSTELPNCGRKELKQRNPFTNKSSRVNSTSSFTSKITTLLLRNNCLSSGFPLFTQQCPNLIFLDLTQNKFTGELPGWINEAMPRLVMLRLRSNYFSGHIPNAMMELHNVRILDLSNNNFSGAIPGSLQNLKALIGTGNGTQFENPFEETYYVNFGLADRGQYNDSLSVVIKGQVLEYSKNTIYLMSIDLSCNSLTGEIPEELSFLAGLVSLNLSSNLLSGNIPYKIGKLRSLESLDLSKNTLGGGIPQSLTDLTYLSYLNLSYNNLSGRIPSGHQLDILKADDPASMYIGNPGLCGHPIPRECPGSPRDPPANNDLESWRKHGLSQMDFLLGLITGFVASAWMVFCGLLFMKRWRYAYFGLLDELYDRLFVISVVTWRKWFRSTDVN